MGNIMKGLSEILKGGSNIIDSLTNSQVIDSDVLSPKIFDASNNLENNSVKKYSFGIVGAGTDGKGSKDSNQFQQESLYYVKEKLVNEVFFVTEKSWLTSNCEKMQKKYEIIDNLFVFSHSSWKGLILNNGEQNTTHGISQSFFAVSDEPLSSDSFFEDEAQTIPKKYETMPMSEFSDLFKFDKNSLAVFFGCLTATQYYSDNETPFFKTFARLFALKNKVATIGADGLTSPYKSVKRRADNSYYLYYFDKKGNLQIKKLGKYLTPEVIRREKNFIQSI
jgi:hypothetical protein